MRPLTFIEPESISEVVRELRTNSAALLAGGSDLLGELKEGTRAYERLVSLGALDSLRSIEAHEGGLRIGALVTISELELSSDLTGPYSILAEAARGVATPEVRNQGTLGGNLCQRPRCYFYRNALTPCLKKGGDACPAVESPYQNYLSIMGGHACYAVHPSDLAPPLIVLDARIVIEGPAGPREVSAVDFFIGPEQDVTRETVVQPDEVVTHVVLPPMPAGWRGLYSKARERTAGDFALASAAIGYELSDGRMTGIRIVLGSIAPTPFSSRDAEVLLEGQAPSQELAERAADTALAGAQPLSHNAYKVDMARALIVRGVMRLAQ